MHEKPETNKNDFKISQLCTTVTYGNVAIIVLKLQRGLKFVFDLKIYFNFVITQKIHYRFSKFKIIMKEEYYKIYVLDYFKKLV